MKGAADAVFSMLIYRERDVGTPVLVRSLDGDQVKKGGRKVKRGKRHDGACKGMIALHGRNARRRGRERGRGVVNGDEVMRRTSQERTEIRASRVMLCRIIYHMYRNKG